MQLALLILAIKNNRTQGLTSPVIAVAAAFSLATACAICLLSSVEHKRTVRPSTLLSVYLFFTVIIDIARVRTQWLAEYSVAIAALISTSLVLKIIILFLEARSKRDQLKTYGKQLGPEELSSFYSKSLFLWLIHLLRFGYRKVLSLNDLYCIDEQLLSGTLSRNFEPAWESGELWRSRIIP